MKTNRCYWVAYRLYRGQPQQGLQILAGSKEEAYDKATYDTIPLLTGEMPYSVWVESVTYQNGRRKEFNTCEGLPY